MSRNKCKVDMSSMFPTDAKWMFVIWVFLFFGSQVVQSKVTYDGKSLMINGQRRILLSGSIHYPRSTPDMWEDLIIKGKRGGLDVIDTYVFWNAHEPSPGNYTFEGRYDLVRFLKTVQKAGLYAHLRIGPYVCAEWNYGGFPVWLKFVPGIKFRRDNEPFKRAMQGFTEKIVNLMKIHNLFESQGGPIILSQIENEYGNQGKLLGQEGYNYMNWAAKMAVGLNTGVPWVMCKENDAPDPVINTCNGFYCNTFIPNKPYKPLMWTEAWTGWFTEFRGPIVQRPVQDIAFAVARFIQRGGSFVNYYMYHGGTNFGRSAGGPFVTTSYDYDAPIDEYGMLRQPKYGHLKQLHRAIKLCEHALVSADPTITSLGRHQQAHVYSSKDGKCAAFLSNYDKKSFVKLLFNNKHYTIPPWSISILPDCRNVFFNTAQVGTLTWDTGMLPSGAKINFWQSYNDDSSSLGDERSTMTFPGLVDQLNVTRDSTDYLWYKTSVNIKSSESFLQGGRQPYLTVVSRGHAIHVFINGELIGSKFGKRKGRRVIFTKTVTLRPGKNHIAFLSLAVGLPNLGRNFEAMATGVLGPVALHGLDSGSWDLSSHKWTYQVGMKGESLNLATPNGIASVEWMDSKKAVRITQPMTWHKAYFDAPKGHGPLGLDMASMGKGEVWINGQSLGRYWSAHARGSCQVCNYARQFKPNKCQHGCGKPSQKWYHVPRSWLKPTGNLLVVFEELGGNPTRISLGKRSVTKICSQVSEHHPSVKNWRAQNSGNKEEQAKRYRPRVHLHCAKGHYISAITFASFGTPQGSCGSFRQGNCHAPISYAVLAKRCKGKQRCAVAVSSTNFMKDPCPRVLKRLSVEAVCAPEQSSRG